MSTLFVPAAYVGSGGAVAIGSAGASLSIPYTLNALPSGVVATGIASIYQISTQVSTGASILGTFSVVPISPGVYSGGGFGVYALQGIGGYPDDISISGNTITVTWHVGDTASLVALGLNPGATYAVFVSFIDVFLNVVDAGGGGGGGTEPTPGLVTRDLTGVSMRWPRREELADVALHRVGLLVKGTWPWGGLDERRLLMDELRRTVTANSQQHEIRHDDLWSLFTYPGTTTAGASRYLTFDEVGAGLDQGILR